MSDWSHGYNVSLSYTYGFYRELAPEWLDLCVRVGGFVPPSRNADGGFRYLELGSGQGMGLCLLAAANPEGEFVGVDFNPEHIAHANALVEAGKLTNIRFIEGDFDVLGSAWPADLGQFDYVVLHGIYSWVPPMVRNALVRCLDQALVAGGVVYNSYNSKPGWLTTMPFQHLARRLQVVTNKNGPQVVDNTVSLFEQLSENGAAVFKALPGLMNRVESVKKQNRNYLVQEYLHENWHPLWFSEVMGELRGAKLNFVGTATAAEMLLPGPLPEGLRKIVDSQPDPVLRQEVIDCAINQQFRRDIFSRGARRSFQRPLESAMDVVFYLAKTPASEPLKVASSYGELELKQDVVEETVRALQSGPKTIRELVKLPGQAARGTGGAIQTLLLLLQSGVISVGRQNFDSSAAQAFNATVVRAVCEGAPYNFLSVPATGGGMSVSDVECMMIDTLRENDKADNATLAAGLRTRLDRLGRNLAQNGEPLQGDDLAKKVDQLVGEFTDKKVPAWRALGVIA